MPVFLRAKITKDDVYTSLFQETSEELQDLTEECLQMLCSSMQILLRRQLADQLEGGKFSVPSPDIREETSNVPVHNILSERDFSHLDRLVTSKPNISAIASSSAIQFCKNKTAKWLHNSSKENRDKIMLRVSKMVPHWRKKNRVLSNNVREERIQNLAEKKVKDQEREKKKTNINENLSSELGQVGGLWTQANVQNKIGEIEAPKSRMPLPPK
jgi:aspartyl-tRNA synthetase